MSWLRATAAKGVEREQSFAIQRLDAVVARVADKDQSECGIEADIFWMVELTQRSPFGTSDLFNPQWRIKCH